MASYPALGTIGQEYILEEQYKTLFGYPNGNVNNSLSQEVPGTSRPFILQNQIYSQEIPITAPSDFGSTGYTGIGGINVSYQKPTSCPYLTKYYEVPLSNDFLSTSSNETGNGALTWWFKGANQNDPAKQVINNILNRGVPNNLDPNNGYIPTLYINGQSYTFGNAQYPWTYNVNSGIVLFTGSSTSGTSNVTPVRNTPITFTFWRYDGAIGSGSTGSGDSYWEATGTTGIQYGALSVETDSTNSGSIYTQNILAKDTTSNVNLYTNLETGSLTIGSNASTCNIKSTFTDVNKLVIYDELQWTWNNRNIGPISPYGIQSYTGGGTNLAFIPLTTDNYSYEFRTSSSQQTANASLIIANNTSTFNSALVVGGTATFNNYVPVCSVGATSSNQLVNYNTLTGQNYTTLPLVQGNSNIWTGTNSFNTSLPTSTLTPSLPEQLITKTFADNTYIDFTTDQNISAPNKRFAGLHTTALNISPTLGGGGNRQQIYITGSDLAFDPIFNSNRYAFYCKDAVPNTTMPLLINSATTTISNALSIRGLATFSNGAVFNTTVPTCTITATLPNELVNYNTLTGQNYTTLPLVQGNSNIWTGTNSFNTSLPTSTLTPSLPEQLITKTFADNTYIDFTTDQNISAPNKRFAGLHTTALNISPTLGGGGNRQQIYITGSDLAFDPIFNSNRYAFYCKDAVPNTTMPLLINSATTTISNALSIRGLATFSNGAVFNTTVPTCTITATLPNELVNYNTLTGQNYTTKSYVDSKTYQVLNFSTEVTNIKKSIIYRNATTITSSSITAKLDGPPTIKQIYTFGKQIDNLWVAVTSTGTNVYSISGSTWETNTANLNSILTSGNDVAWNGSYWIAVGSNSNNNTKSVAWSDDGKTWTASTSGNPFGTNGVGNGVAYNGGIWVAVGSVNRIIFSSNPKQSWTQGNNPFGTGVGNGVACNGDLWVAVGSVNTIVYTNAGQGNWTLATNIFSGGVGNGVAWNGSMWVAVGKGNSHEMAYSYDGITWTANGNPFNSGEGGFCVAWNGKIWVAGGGGNNNNAIIYSYDGINWLSATSTMFNGANNMKYVKSIKWSGRVWVAVGSTNDNTVSNIANSQDGIHWYSASSTNTANTIFNGVAFNSSRPSTITFNDATGSISSTNISLSSGDQLDVVCDSYYNTGFTFTNCSMSIDN
jgi:hypothetical protein